jgi:hypothetical protein
MRLIAAPGLPIIAPTLWIARASVKESRSARGCRVGPRRALPEQRSQARARALREATPRPAHQPHGATGLCSLRWHGREAQHRAACDHSPSDVAIGIPIPDTVPRLTAGGYRPGSDSTIAALRALEAALLTFLPYA